MRKAALLWLMILVTTPIAEATPTRPHTHGKFFSSNRRFFVGVGGVGGATFQVFDTQKPGPRIWEFTHKVAFDTHYLVSDDGEVVVDLTLWNGRSQIERTPTLDTVCMTFIGRQGVFRTREVRDFYTAPTNAAPRHFPLSVTPWFREPIIERDVFSFVTDEDRQFDISIKTGDVLREQPAPFDRMSQPTRIMMKTLMFGGAFAVCIALVVFGLLRKGRQQEVD